MAKRASLRLPDSRGHGGLGPFGFRSLGFRGSWVKGLGFSESYPSSKDRFRALRD